MGITEVTSQTVSSGSSWVSLFCASASVTEAAPVTVDAWLAVEAALEGIDSEASTAPIVVEDRAAEQAVRANNRKALITRVNMFFMDHHI
jgi:hypothetical protein